MKNKIIKLTSGLVLTKVDTLFSSAILTFGERKFVVKGNLTKLQKGNNLKLPPDLKVKIFKVEPNLIFSNANNESILREDGSLSIPITVASKKECSELEHAEALLYNSMHCNLDKMYVSFENNILFKDFNSNYYIMKFKFEYSDNTTYCAVTPTIEFDEVNDSIENHIKGLELLDIVTDECNNKFIVKFTNGEELHITGDAKSCISKELKPLKVLNKINIDHVRGLKLLEVRHNKFSMRNSRGHNIFISPYLWSLEFKFESGANVAYTHLTWEDEDSKQLIMNLDEEGFINYEFDSFVYNMKLIKSEIEGGK